MQNRDPLAARFTEVYRDLKPYWGLEAHECLHHGRHPLAFENPHPTARL